jgi:rsbT co-antagonist protein RsbR
MVLKIGQSKLPQILREHKAKILEDWRALVSSGRGRTGRLNEGEIAAQTKDVLTTLSEALQAAEHFDINDSAFASVRELLEMISRSRALQSFTPSETATFAFSLKQPVFQQLGKLISDPVALEAEVWAATVLIDSMGLYITDMFQKSREEIILRQQRELSELSTPVVRLWKGILALPLIGTLDSERTQVVMENLLRSLVENMAEIAIIDITGVPTVDTQVAQHLLKTIAAARLMGADCIVSGIRPQIAQTMVHLGVELNVVSKSTLADAFAVALERLNKTVVTLKKA